MNKTIAISSGLALIIGIVIGLIIPVNIGQANTTTAITTVGKGFNYVAVRAGGASFINPQMQTWISIFTDETGAEVTYNSVGSGAGISGFLQGIYDIGASDVALPKGKHKEVVAKYGTVLQMPDVVGSVVVIYNLPELSGKELRLSGEVIVDIYMSKVRYWDDPKIAEMNPGIRLPHQEIFGVHRSDASGTTYIFTTYLSIVSGEWKEKVGANFTAHWLIDDAGRGLGGRKNDGVAALVKQTPYSIGYVEFSYAYVNKMPTALLKNKDGYFVSPTKETISAALESSGLGLPEPTGDWGNVIPLLLNKPGKDSYPIVSCSYLFIKKDYKDANKAYTIYKFLKLVYTDGMSEDNVVSGYLPLPCKLKYFVITKVLPQITVNGKPVEGML